MQRFGLPFPLLLAALLAAASGCGGNGDSEPSPGAPADAQGIKRVEAEQLPPLADPLPPLEGGTLEVSPPERVKILPRSSKYVCGFHYSDPSSPPRLLVLSESNPFSGIERVTEENLETFAAQISQRLEKQGLNPLEPVLPMVIGGVPCARYVLPARFKNAEVDRQMVQTLRNGKLYTVDLQVFAGTILDYRDDAYAVLAGMKFIDAPPSDSTNAPPGGSGAPAVENVPEAAPGDDAPAAAENDP